MWRRTLRGGDQDVDLVEKIVVWTVGKQFHYEITPGNLGFIVLTVDPVINFSRGFVVHIFFVEVTGLRLWLEENNGNSQANWSPSRGWRAASPRWISGILCKVARECHSDPWTDLRCINKRDLVDGRRDEDMQRCTSRSCLKADQSQIYSSRLLFPRNV